jgi:cytochrome b561
LSEAPPRWTPTVVVLHWLNAALILALLALGGVMTHSPFGAGTTFELYQAHKSLGFVALVLTILRLFARLSSAAPAPVSGWEGLISRAVQAAFYVLTLAAIAAGWLVVSASPLPVPTRFFGLFVIPNIAPPDATLFALGVLAHATAAYVIAGLVALHVAGALKHHWIDRDGALKRMLPQRF